MLIFALILLCLIFFLPLIFHFKYKEIRWDWDGIDISEISFPKSFIWGTATASHQVEGNCNNNWSKFEESNKGDGTPNITNAQISGLACDHWNRYKEDIKLISDLGVKHYRFSLEWSKIEPKMGRYDDKAIQHYSDVIDELIKNNIEPVITLHHFSHPLWFDEMGAFEKESNIPYLVSFSRKVFEQYSDRVKFWCTINEPGVVSMQG